MTALTGGVGSIRAQLAGVCATTSTLGPGQTRILTNLATLVDGATAADHRELAELVTTYGTARVARVQAGLDVVLGTGPGLPVTAAAVVVLAGRDTTEALLLADGVAPHEAAGLATASQEQAWHLVLAGVDGSQTLPDLTGLPAIGADPAFDLAGWRELLAPLAHTAWSDYADDLSARVADLADDWLSDLVAGCLGILRDQQADNERRMIAQRIRELVEGAGVTQGEFAEMVGTSRSRFSTYVNGRVTPSATMMLRITRTARALRAGQPAAEDPPAIRSVS